MSKRTTAIGVAARIPDPDALDKAIADAVRAAGIPASPEASAALADAIYPILREKRTATAAEASVRLRRAEAVSRVANPRPYTVPMLDTVIRRTAGLEPGGQNIVVDQLDAASGELVRQSVPAWVAAEDPEAVAEFIRRLQAAARRHARQGALDLVLDTARLNEARYRRVLVGETCPFCAALASRGAIYYSEGSAQFEAHNGCDCQVELVPKGARQFDAESARLRQLYERAKDPGVNEGRSHAARYRRLLEKEWTQ